MISIQSCQLALQRYLSENVAYFAAKTQINRLHRQEKEKGFNRISCKACPKSSYVQSYLE